MGDSSGFETSDKFTWHRYTQFYEPYLARLDGAENILEFGVFHGASIRYLHDRYPSAQIVGCDILPIQPDWPESDRIRYVRLDQGNNQELGQLFVEHPGPFDLIIEDGSHRPEHQRNCLVASLSHLRAGGVYILEDLHTSHPDHSTMRRWNRKRTNAYHVVLAFEHLQALESPLTGAVVARLTADSWFTENDLRTLFAQIDSVQIYRRATLPLRCYRCGSADFAYERLRCLCGVQLMETADSMSAVFTARRA
jgi:23S rRNA U2552 (ribose-2'-O)-methylase RlmE/FtsJ